MRGSLRQISRADAKFRLDDGFADRVIQAAVAQATAEGLRDGHPLLKVAEHPNTASQARRFPVVKVASALVALAASITLGIVFLQPPGEAVGIASSAPADAPFIADVAEADFSARSHAAEDTMTDALSVVAEAVEQSLNTEKLASVAEKSTIPVDSSDATMASAADDSTQAKAPEHAVAAIQKPLRKSPTEAEAAALLGESNILTLLVKRTEAGRQTRAVRAAMRGAEIDSAVRRELTKGMVSAVADSVKKSGTDGSITQLVFLEVPAKKVDVFYARLMANSDGIESVGLGVIATPAIRRFVKSLSPDAVRDIRHSKTLELQGSQVGFVADQLASGQAFLPAESIRGIPLTVSADSHGPDQLARIVVLIQ
jgi:hypothetical protein